MADFSNLINLIVENEDKVDYDHNGIKDLNVIDGELYKDIIEHVKQLKDQSIDKKEYIKKAVKEAFELEDQDLIIVKKQQIVIKIISTIKRDINERRFNGYSEDEIEDLYNEYFDKKTLDNFIKDVSNSVYKYLFIRKQVTNEFYEKNVYTIVQSYIAKELVDFEDESNEFRKGFAGYIFRVNFIKVFSHISDQILEAISFRDEYLMNWIKYYNGQVIIKHNKRYEAPAIVNPDGQKYNPSALFGTIAMWFKTIEKIKNLKKRLYDLTKQLDKLKINDLSPIEYKEELLAERREIEKDIYDANEKVKVLLDEKRLCKDVEKKYDINDEIQTLRTQIKDDKQDLEEINSQISSVDTVSTKRLEEDKTRVQKDIEREEKALKQNKKIYNSIQSALVKALTSKRKPI
jgi:hypothetical protein